MIFGKYVNKFYLKYWYHFVFGIFFLVTIDLAALYIPEYISNVVSIFYNVDRSSDLATFWTGDFSDVNSYAHFIMSLIIVGGVIFIGRIGWRLAINNLGVRVENELRSMLFDHAEKLSVTYYNNQKTGVLMSYFNNDLEAIKNSFTEGVIFLIDGVVLGSLTIVKLFMLNWQLALVAVVPLVLVGMAGSLIGKAISTKYDKQLSAFEKMSDFSQENFSGIAVIKAFVREGYQMIQFAKHNKRSEDTNIEYIKLGIMLETIIDMLIYVVLIIIFLGGGYLAIYNPAFDVGMFTEFIGYFDILIWPMIALAYLINIISEARAALKKVSKFLDAPIDLKDVEVKTDVDSTHITGDLRFNGLNFLYPDGKNSVLSNINLHIYAGENIGIVGRTGSGKSTLVKVLLKIYNIDRGMILFDGKDINDIPAKILRDSIGYVAQNAFLFSDLVSNNISFGKSNITSDEIREAASFACIDGSIRKFKNGYRTLVGEKGTTLSGGQRQRIAMARAVVKDPTILILDDSVSAVDSETEIKILENIRRLRKNKSTFIVSSRISSIQSLDHIIVMDKGQIIGYGKHDELINACKLYRGIVEAQALEEEEK